MEFVHKSVLLKETVDSLNVSPEGVYADGTLGGGGHSEEILRRLGPSGKLIGIDRDEEALCAAKERLKAYEGRFQTVHSNYGDMPEVLKKLGVEKVNGIVLDLGVSSYQLDNAERGFSYMADAPLDMRMDQSQQMTAYDIVNDYSEYDLARIIREYGEDKCAGSIASHIAEARKIKPVSTTGELVEIIRRSIPMRLQKSGGHPAKRTFQAIRIELNQELTVLKDCIDGLIGCLEEHGRLSIITFHSLEDRIVKEAFRRNEKPCTCPPSFPVCVCGKKSRGFVVTRKPVLPTQEEMETNSRARSAKLRVFERRTEE